jgi:hypothetical protein
MDGERDKILENVRRVKHCIAKKKKGKHYNDNFEKVLHEFGCSLLTSILA